MTGRVILKASSRRNHRMDAAFVQILADALAAAGRDR